MEKIVYHIASRELLICATHLEHGANGTETVYTAFRAFDAGVRRLVIIFPTVVCARALAREPI